MAIDYNHLQNLHTTCGARAAFPKLIGDWRPQSILDVGCGTGTWLRAALDSGVTDVLGIDGIPIPPDQLLIPANSFSCCDLTKPVDLGRRFDLAFCLEVAEHIEEAHTGTLLATLVRHSDRIIFSAACPGQPGQQHVNCQWPTWWQERFNQLGYVCDDELRWRIWEEEEIEPWYRQNVFIARRAQALFSNEPRLKAVIHPQMIPHMIPEASMRSLLRNIENGSMHLRWYLVSAFKALAAKLRRALRDPLSS